jgi:hypothetical protein
VAGVALGIGTLLWATSGSGGGDPTVHRAGSSAAAPLDQPAVGAPAATSPSAVPTPAATTPGAAPATVSATTTAPPAAPAHEPVLVLNDSRVAGLAQRAAQRFTAAGWPVRDTGSLTGRIRTTTVYYAPGQQAEAEAFARAFPEVRRVLPRLATLPGAGLTVVVTRDAA